MARSFVIDNYLMVTQSYGSRSVSEPGPAGPIVITVNVNDLFSFNVDPSGIGAAREFYGRIPSGSYTSASLTSSFQEQILAATSSLSTDFASYCIPPSSNKSFVSFSGGSLAFAIGSLEPGSSYSLYFNTGSLGTTLGFSETSYSDLVPDNGFLSASAEATASFPETYVYSAAYDPVPFSLGTPGAISLKNKGLPYKIFSS